MSNNEPPDPYDGQREPVIVVRECFKSFGDLTVMKGINLTVYEGETMVVMGGSGCGKSTLLRHMIGSLKPDSGTITLFGRDITELDEDELNEVRKQFGILFQSGALYNSMSVKDNVALPIREHGSLDEATVEIMVTVKLQMVGMLPWAEAMPATLSGGQKKRVGLARAIALDPKVIFYDEPSAGLDPVTSTGIDMLMMDLSGKLGVTSIVVTHEMDSAFRIADRMCMLDRGNAVMIGTCDEFKTTDDPLVKQFTTGSEQGPIPLVPGDEEYAEKILGEHGQR